MPTYQPDELVSRSPKIGDYAVIGDCRAAALISSSGSLDWLCWPQFDSPAIFAGILDEDEGGYWRISPLGPYRTTRSYIPNSNVLQTTFRMEAGEAVLTDLMSVASEQRKREHLLPDHEIIRQVECLSGQIRLEIKFNPRINYGLKAAKIRDRGRLGLSVETTAGVYWLRSSHELQLSSDASTARANIVLRAGDLLQFSFTYSEESPAVLPPLGESMQDRICSTVRWWQQWAARARYEGSYRDLVVRSALTLKLLTYAPSGAVVAAATTSLPERVGGSLNWDYRYCWLRDASLTIRAMLGLGYFDEADAFMNWLLHATALTRPELKILYTVFGENAPRERELRHLAGYHRSRPVRIGNEARNQLQLDVYGEVIDAAAQYAHAGGEFDRGTQKVLNELGQYISQNWDRPDEGIWEPRGARQDHTHSRLLCWVALDRLMSMHDHGQLAGGPVEKYRRERALILNQVKHRSWNHQLRTYVSTLGGDCLDASLLLLSYYGFERAGSERMRSTYRALRKDLGQRDGLIYRYSTSPSEGAFGICSFWEIEYLALGGGTLAETRELFARVSAFGNDVELFAEEIDPTTGDALGNFPQAFTHVGLISAALSISERAKGERQLPHRGASAEENHSGERVA